MQWCTVVVMVLCGGSALWCGGGWVVHSGGDGVVWR